MQDKGGRVCMMNLAPTPSPSLFSLSSQGREKLHVSHNMAIYFYGKPIVLPDRNINDNHENMCFK